MKRIVWLASMLPFALLATPTRAEQSIFSLTFLGIREEWADARCSGLGVRGIGLGDDKTALSLNPASFAPLGRMTLSLLGGATTRTSRDATTEDSRGESAFPHLRAALPLPGDFVFSAGFLGLRNFRGSFVLPKESVGPFSYRHRFDREGSLYEVPLGLARSVHPRLHVGVTVDLVLGTVTDAWTTGGDSLLALRTRRRDGVDGTTVTLGALGDLLPWLRLGVAWTAPVDLDVETRTTIEDGRVGSSSTALRTTRSRSTASYPATLRAGASARLGSRWLLTADGQHRNWENWDGRLYGAPATGTEWRIGGGIEAKPHRGGARVLSYRVGVSESQWPQEFEGDPVREMTVHGGLGMDLRGGMGRLDASVEYTRAGSIDTNGFEEERWSFLLSLTGQEVWRRKSPRGDTSKP